MTPEKHFIYGTAAAALLAPVMGEKSVAFWAASCLIDIDHYLDYVYHNGGADWGIRNMFAYHAALERLWGRPDFLNLEVFHTAEFIVPLFFLSHWLGSAWLMAAWWGMVFHIALDAAGLSMLGILKLRAHSFIEYFIRKRACRRRGMDPSDVCSEAVRMVREGTGR